MTRWSALAALAIFGCGGDGTSAVPAQSDFRGTWSAPVGPPGCVFAAAFAAQENYGAGVVCRSASEVDVEWGTGTFTLAPDGRINFYPASGGCRNLVTYAEYGGPADRPTITLPNPFGVVMAPSASPAFPSDAVPGCFAADWTFTPSP